MALEKRLKQFGNLKGAPDWWGKPLRDLDFEWSKEEKLEIERYCEKILKNVSEEDMTPLQRLKATWEGKPRDRVFFHVLHGNVFGGRILDGYADAIKPIDIFRNPKLWVKVNLANMARYKLDYANAYGITYGEEMWGANAKMIEYGNPVIVGEPKIKSIESLEGIEVPDPEKDGLYPGYLWANRELRRIYDEYGLSKVLPIMPRICGDPHSIVMMYMTGWAPFVMNMRKNPELNRRCLDLATEFEIRYGRAVAKAARADGLYMCSMTGAQAAKGNEWLADYWAKVGKALAPTKAYLMYAYGFGLAAQWIPILVERGALGPGNFSGGLHDYQCDYKTMIDLHRKHNLYIASMNKDTTLLDGPVEAIEEEIKHLLELGKSYPKFCLAIGMVDYLTPPSHLDAAIAAAKKYGKY